MEKAREMENCMDIIIWILVMMAIFCIYFLPSLVANNKENANGVYILNLFFGWTFLGWVLALIWAVSSKEKEGKSNLVKCPYCAELIQKDAIFCKHCKKSIVNKTE